MGRPRLYKTEEEQKEAARQRKREHYQRQRRREYARTQNLSKETEAPIGRATRSLTDEERRVHERAKAARYYQRHKSEIQARRKAGPRRVDHSDGIPTASRSAPGPVWQQHINYLAAQLAKHRHGLDLKSYTFNVVKGFLANKDVEGILSCCPPLDALLERAYRLQNDICNQVGTGPLLLKLLLVIADIRQVINCVQDVWAFAVLGMDSFREACINESFMRRAPATAHLHLLLPTASRTALSTFKMTETSEKTSKPTSENVEGGNVAGGVGGGGGNAPGGSAASPPPYAGYSANPHAPPPGFNQPPPGLGPPPADSRHTVDPAQYAPGQFYAQYPPYQYYPGGYPPYPGAPAGAPPPSYLHHHQYPAGQANAEPPPLSPYLAYRHPHGHVSRDCTPSGGYPPQQHGYQQPNIHVGRDRTPSGGPPLQQNFPPFLPGPLQQGPYYPPHAHSHGQQPPPHDQPLPPPAPPALHNQQQQQQQQEEKQNLDQHPPSLPPPPPPPQDQQCSTSKPKESESRTPPPPPTMTYSLRKTITPRKGDDSVETQRLRKLREIWMSGEQQSVPQHSEQQPVLVASARDEVESLMTLPESMLLSFALDAGELEPSPRSNTLCSLSPPAELPIVPPEDPAPATKPTESSSTAPQKITKADLKAFGIPPPSRLAPPTSTPLKKSGKTHSRSQSVVPPSTPKNCASKRATSIQPTTPAADAFQHMGTLHPGSPLRAAERIVGINVQDDKDAEGASSGEFKVGGLTKEEREFVQKTAEEILIKLNDASESINRPVDMFLTFLNKLLSNKVTYSRSLWNYYTSYFWRHVEEERERVGNPDATPSDAFPSFQEAYPHWQELMVMDFHRSAAAAIETIGDRERQFDKWFGDLAARGEEMHGFQFFLGACGESVNEDQALGSLHLSKNLGEGFLQERLMMTGDALIGQMKTHSYDYVSKQYCQRIAEERDRGMDNDKQDNGDESSSSGDESEVENTRRTALLKRVRKLGDSALTKRLHELVGMSNEAINKTNTDVGRKIVRDYFQALIRAEGGKADNVNLPWRELGTKLASQGLSIVGWAHKVPFPNKTSKPDGIKSAGVEGIRKLIFGLRDATIRLERKEASKLQNSKTPVAVEEAPPPDSEQKAGARYFLDGTMDLRGPPRQGSAPSTSSSRAKDAAAPKAKAQVRSVTFEEPPSKPATRSSKSTKKGKGKQKAVIISDDDDDDDDDDLPLAPPPPPPAASKKQSSAGRARTLPAPAASKKRDAQVERIPVKVGNVEVPIPFVDNSEDDLYSPSPVRPSSKRPRSLASPINESDEDNSPTKQVPQELSASTGKSADSQYVKPRPRKIRKAQSEEPEPEPKPSSTATILPQAPAPPLPPPAPGPLPPFTSDPTAPLQPPPLHRPPPDPATASANASALPPHYYHPFYQQQQHQPPPHHFQFHDASGSGAGGQHASGSGAGGQHASGLGAGGQHVQRGWAPGQFEDASRG
ncbi:hypothetical protein MD484_g5043, partial [Candolleomyces efflorescens]